MPKTAIPAAHLNALGFEKGDPPVQSAKGLPIGFRQREVLQRSPRMPLLVEESMPALLRALARQYGATLEPGEVPQWCWHGSSGKGWWRLATATWGHNFSLPGGAHAPDSAQWSAVPALTADMGRLEALAAVIVWQVSR